MDSLNIILSGLKFLSNFSFKFNNIDSVVSGYVLVDTGCTRVNVSLGGLYRIEFLRELKRKDIESYKLCGKPKISHEIGIGTVGLSIPDIDSLSTEELMKLPNIAFYHKVENFKINGFDFGSIDVAINYDRKCHALLGMSVLQHYNTAIRLNKYNLVEMSISRRNSKEKISCKERLSELLKSKLSLKESEYMLSEDYDESLIHECMYELLQDHNVVEGKL